MARKPSGHATRVATLQELSRVLNSTLDEHEVRKRAVEAATQLVGAEVGSLLLAEPGGELFFEVALGKKGERVKAIRLKPGQGIAGWVAQTGEAALVHDVRRDPRFFQAADEKTGFVTRTMLCVPVRAKDRILGVLQVINAHRERFTRQDQEDLIALSHQVAIAIENANLYKEVVETFAATVSTLAEAIEKRDAYTGGHTRRIMEYSLVVGRRLGLQPDDLETLRLTALLHDIGKIGVEDRVLRNPGRLDEEECRQMQRHPVIGAEIVGQARRLERAAAGIRAHHEHVDGRGYPDGKRGATIPLESRIIGVVDAFDAMTSDRPYRKGRDAELALTELRRHTGTQFDPAIVTVFLEAYEAGEITPILQTAQTSSSGVAQTEDAHV